MDSLHLTVEAYGGYKGETTPRSFTIDGRRLIVKEIIERWYSETHCYFRLLASDGQRYVMRLDLDEGGWELVMQELERAPNKKARRSGPSDGVS